MADRLPTRLLSRAAATARIAASVGRAGAKRALRRSEADDAQFGEAMFQELDRLKGLAMKVGQVLSYMDVGLPEETVRRLAQLQRGVAPLDWAVVARQLEAELGAPIATLFDRFDEAPVAAASIGQVHRASVRGVEVAVKVRYPGVREMLDSDTRQLRGIASVASLATAVDGQALVADLRARVLEECDYALEARHQQRFAAMLAGDDALVVPAVVEDRCGEGVLTTVWHDGDRFEQLRDASPARRSAVARTLVRFPWSTLLSHGVLHADPHPGNFLFPDGDRVVVLDFGCVKELAPSEVAAFRDLVEVLTSGRRSELGRVAEAVGLLGRPDRIDYDDLWDMLRWMFAPYLQPWFRFERAWWDAGLRFSRPTHANTRFLAFPPAWLWLQRTMFGLHSVLLKLEAEGDFRSVALRAMEG